MDLFDTALFKQLFAFGKKFNGTVFNNTPMEAARVNNKQFLDVILFNCKTKRQFFVTFNALLLLYHNKLSFLHHSIFDYIISYIFICT